MEHGSAKLARGVDAFPTILQELGVPAAHLMGWLAIIVEIVGGLAVLLGAFVPLVSLPMAAVLLVAATTVHLPYGFSSIKPQAVTAAGAQFGPPGFVGAAASLMAGFRALHPPAGVDAFLIAQLDLPWSWIISPVLVGAILLAGFSQLWAWGGRCLAMR